jgi:hypothetical protein
LLGDELLVTLPVPELEGEAVADAVADIEHGGTGIMLVLKGAKGLALGVTTTPGVSCVEGPSEITA